MKIKSFAIMFLCMMTLCSTLMLVGCGDKYASVKIQVDKTEISLKLGANAETDGDLSDSATLLATLMGASAEMTRDMSFHFDDKSIVSTSIIDTKGDTNSIKLTASNAGTTKMYIVSNENADIKSEPISVTVYRDAETMTFDNSKKPAVKVGESLSLSSNDLIKFAVNGERVKIYPNEATFELMQPDDERWNAGYGNALPEGVTVENNVLSVADSAQCGIVQLVATMGELSTPVYVMIYREINAEEAIALKQNDVEVSEEGIKAIINVGPNAMVLVPSIVDTSQYQNYKLRITSNNDDILRVDEANVSGQINAQVLDSGSTSIDVCADIIDPVTKEAYVTFKKTYKVQVNRIVTSILVSSDDVESTDEHANMAVQDVYVNDVAGKKIVFDVYPNNTEHSKTIENTNVVLSVTQIDGSDFTIGEDEDFSQVEVYVGKSATLYKWGDEISAGSTIYVRLGKDSKITNGFRLNFSSYDPSSNSFVERNYIDFSVEVGVQSVTIENMSELNLGVGMSADFSLSYTDRNGNKNGGNPKFSFSSSEYYSISQKEGYTYTITALKEGDTTVTVLAESGAKAEMTLRVRKVLESMGITVNDKSVVSVTNADIIQGEAVKNIGIKAFTVAMRSNINLGYTLNPSQISASSFWIESITTSDTAKKYISVGQSFVEGKLTLTALNVTETDKPVQLTVRFGHYIVEDGVIVSTTSERTIEVTVYKPISYMYWGGTINGELITQNIVNINKLNYLDKEKGTATLKINYDETASYFVNGKSISWSVEAEHKSKITINKTSKEGEVEVTANLSETDTESNYNVEIYASVKDYNTTYSLTCVLKIQNPEKVSGIRLLNDYDSTYGIRLNAVGVSNRTQFELIPQVVPSNAYNQNLRYVILDKDKNEVSKDDAIIELDETNPNLIKAKSDKSGSCYVRIFPEDALLTESTTYKDVSLYIDVLVVVEDGTVERPYTIYEPAEFVAIGNNESSMTKNYLLMNSLDVSAYSSSFPLGKNYVFSGTLKTKGDIKLTVSGLPVVQKAGENESGDTAYLGIFSQIIASDTTQNSIENIDFYFNSGSINLNILGDNVTKVYAGLLAGRIEGNLNNVFVGYASYRTNAVNVENIPSDVTNFYYGAVAGELEGGSVGGVYANISLNLLEVPQSTNLAVGGVFGRFAGSEFGQVDSLMSNVKITISTISTQDDDTSSATKLDTIIKGGHIDEGIGGLVGIADTYTTDKVTSNGNIFSMQVTGTISAPDSVNVGGLVGLNNITLGSAKSDNSKLYKNLANVRVNGGANVGGFVGANYSIINYGVAEMYDSVSVTNPSELIWVQGLYNVGGFTGYSSSSGMIQYSYAMSYVNRTMAKYGEAGKYYGDIIGSAQVGGFVGYSSSIINSCFAFTQIQQIKDTRLETETTVSTYTGGFAGVISNETNTINHTFAIGAILTANSATSDEPGPYGEYAGNYKGSNAIYQAYACVDISANGSKVYNFAGTVTSDSTVSESFYMVSGTGETTFDGAYGYTYEEMKLTSSTIIYKILDKANWGFYVIDSSAEKQAWVDRSNTTGLNRELPVLLDANGKMLYGQVIGQISATPKDYTATGANLPTYFGYTDTTTGEVLGSVVVLDNIEAQNGQRVIALEDLLNIKVDKTTLIDPSEWKIVIESSDYSIMEVVQPSQNLLNAKLIFKKCGVVKLTLRSLLNIDNYCTIDINVVGGFTDFSLTDNAGNSVFDDDYIMYVKVSKESGYPLYVQFTQNKSDEYLTKKGLVYTVIDTDYIKFNNIAFENSQAFIDSNYATILSGLMVKYNDEDKSIECIDIGVSPYIELQFGGTVYRKIFNTTSLSKSFKAKVYNGISSVGVYTGMEANVESGTEVTVSVDVVTDNEATVEIKDFTLTKDGEVISADNISKYATLIKREVVKVGTNNNYECYYNDNKIENKDEIARIVQKLANGDTDINAYLKIDGEMYDATRASEISAKIDYLITDCVRYTYLLALQGQDRVITQNTVFNLNYTVFDTGSDDTYQKGDTITFIPASIKTMNLSHFTYGANSMEAGEAPGNSISPGTRGMLRIKVDPYYAHFDYVAINSLAIDNTGPLLLQQMIYTKGLYKYIASNAEYDVDGNLKLRKITGIDADGNEYFNGFIYVATLIPSGTAEGSKYRISAVPVRENGNTDIKLLAVQDINLTTTFAPYATLTLDSDYESNIVGRGTVANLRFTGTMLNSELKIEASYMGTGNDRLTTCQFDTQNFKTSYTTGQKEEVDMIIPFYVGILANPDNARIIISVTIESWTSLGGKLNPLRIECTLNIVDYLVKNVYTDGTQGDESLDVSVNTYKTLSAILNVETPKLSDFETYVGYSANESTATEEENRFNAEVKSIESAYNTKRKLANTLGKGDGGIWWVDSGSGFGQINKSSNYIAFLVLYDENDGYKIKGKNTQKDYSLLLSFETTYIYDESANCYRFALLDEVNEENESNKLGTREGGADYIRKLEQEFFVDFTIQTDEDSPYIIDSLSAFEAMLAGADYMLTTDITLNNWKPIDTAINSLDGNGHIIHLNSFATNTDTATANYGLFSTLAEGTVIKNLILDVGDNVYINLQGVANVKFGFVAGINNGIIYNCDVLVMQDSETWKNKYGDSSPGMSEGNADFDAAKKETFAEILDKVEQGDFKTSASTFVMTSKTVNSASVSATVGGLVGENSSTGSITNCRVGRISDEQTLGTSTEKEAVSTQGLNLFASGNVGGLVGENSGVISNSYFANGYVVNYLTTIYSANNTKGAKTGGLVAVQNSGGRIFGSYARGQLIDGVSRSELGGVIAHSTIGGLVHSNSGVISNSYSNLNLSGASGMGGFVYENLSGGRISHSYSLSTVKTEGLINGVFIGVDSEGNLLDNANSVVESCFYLTEEGLKVHSAERAIPLVSDSWSIGSNFEGFAVSTTDSGENTWYMDSTRTYLGPQLYLADQVFVSSRDASGEKTGFERGKKINPLLITSLSSWNNRIFGYINDENKAVHIDKNASYVAGSTEVAYIYEESYIMLLCDIDFDNSISAVTSQMRFKGHLYGNGHIISGLNYAQSSEITAPNNFGLFAEIDGTNNNSEQETSDSQEIAVVSNLTLVIGQSLTSRASHVGVLAGTITNGLIENITITSNQSGGIVTGINMAGALAGLVKGDSYIYNIQSNLKVSALSANTYKKSAYTYYNSKTTNSSKVSYAGGIIGVLDMNKSETNTNISSPRVRNLYVNSVIYSANTPYNVVTDVSGEIVGGIVGLVGTDSEIYKAYFDVGEADECSMILRGRNFTGGLVGENRGTILNSRLALPTADQIESDSSISSTDNAGSYIGYTGLFASADTSNAVGGLVGLNVGGVINYSYNRVAVVNTNAKVVGGLIGLAINAPKTYDTAGSVDPIVTYLQNLYNGEESLLSTVTNGTKYKVSSGRISTEDEANLTLSALLKEVYTTAFVNGGRVIGGLVGAQINAPIYIDSSAGVVSANAYNEKDSEFMKRIADSTTIKYFGSATGYLGLNYASTPTASEVVAYIRDISTGDSSALNLYVTDSIGTYSVNPIGNVAGAMNTAVMSTSFIKSATDSDNKIFATFDNDEWNLDLDKLDYKFPYHKIGYDTPVTEIKSVADFFKYMSNTHSSDYYRIVDDLTITGDDWEEYYYATYDDYGKQARDRKSFGIKDSALVTGKLEGAVSDIVVDGKDATRSAKITFTNFSFEQMRLYHSLFGYTRNFRMSNIDFVYDFGYNTNAISGELEDFALLMISASDTTLNNISVTSLAITAGAENAEDSTEGKLKNLSVVTANSNNCKFIDVRLNASINAKNIKANSTDISIGALIGRANNTTQISGAEQGSVYITYTSGTAYTTYIGALIGHAYGTLNIEGSSSSDNIRGNVSVTVPTGKSTYLGGIIGRVPGTLNLKNYTSAVSVDLTKSGSTENTSPDFVGGITSTISSSSISTVKMLGDININSNTSGSALYVGGIAGSYTISHLFSNAYSGNTTANCSSFGDINVVGNDYAYVYVGGIYGFTQEQITMKNGNKVPSGESKNIYYALYSSADINIDTNATFVYAGGIIGHATQGIMNPSEEDSSQSEYAEFDTPNGVMRISSCGYVGDLIVSNTNSDENTETKGGNNYLGGIVGCSQLLVQDAYSNGAISFKNQIASALNLGGIVGLAENHIQESVALSVINASYNYDGSSTNSNMLIDPITILDTSSLTNSNKQSQPHLEKVFYSPELCGIYSQYNTNTLVYELSAQDAFSSEKYDEILAKNMLTNWEYRSDSQNDTTLTVMLPKVLFADAKTDLGVGGPIQPVIVTEYSEIYDIMESTSEYNHSTIILSQDLSISSGQINQELANIRRIVGNGNFLNIAKITSSFGARENFGLFKEIPSTTLISNIGINFYEIQVKNDGSSNIGVLAGSNYGTIFKVSMGGLPSIDTNYMGNKPTSTVATFSDGASTRYSSTMLKSLEIGTLSVDLQGNYGSVGIMFGTSGGIITQCAVSADVIVTSSLTGGSVNIGGIAGYTKSATLDNIMLNGRNYFNFEVANNVGGVSGSTNNTTVHGVVSNVNILAQNYIDNPEINVGLAFGTFEEGTYKDIIVNTDISSWYNAKFNDLYSKGFTTLQMSGNVATTSKNNETAETAMNYITNSTDGGFRTGLWTRDATTYYGYPRLINIPLEGYLNTGSGESADPYQIAEASQLLAIFKENANGYYCLTRDMVVSSANYKEISKNTMSSSIKELNGMGHTIVPNKLETNTSNSVSSIGLFNEIPADTTICYLGVAIVGSYSFAEKGVYHFGGVAVRNYGTISNCYVVCYDTETRYGNGTITLRNSSANSYVGGLVSQNYGTITKSWSDVSFKGKNGHFGGLIGVQGRADIVKEDGLIEEVKQATVSQCFSLGSIYLTDCSNTNKTDTSVGGLIGKNMSYLSAYVISDCYVYGAKLGANTPNICIGALVGYNCSTDSKGNIVLNARYTYSYVATDYSQSYKNMELVGNRDAITNTNTKDTVVKTNLFAVARYEGNEFKDNDEVYRVDTSNNLGTLTKPGSSSLTDSLRYDIINNSDSLYNGWSISIWVRNTLSTEHGLMPYLNDVTPSDRQETATSKLGDKDVFRLD